LPKKHAGRAAMPTSGATSCCTLR